MPTLVPARALMTLTSHPQEEELVRVRQAERAAAHREMQLRVCLEVRSYDRGVGERCSCVCALR
eukprot:91318-Chlamydomonas_euryale.AAC.3